MFEPALLDYFQSQKQQFVNFNQQKFVQSNISSADNYCAASLFCGAVLATVSQCCKLHAADAVLATGAYFLHLSNDFFLKISPKINKDKLEYFCSVL